MPLKQKNKDKLISKQKQMQMLNKREEMMQQLQRQQKPQLQIIRPRLIIWQKKSMHFKHKLMEFSKHWIIIESHSKHNSLKHGERKTCQADTNSQVMTHLQTLKFHVSIANNIGKRRMLTILSMSLTLRTNCGVAMMLRVVTRLHSSHNMTIK